MSDWPVEEAGRKPRPQQVLPPQSSSCQGNQLADGCGGGRRLIQQILDPTWWLVDDVSDELKMSWSLELGHRETTLAKVVHFLITTLYLIFTIFTTTQSKKKTPFVCWLKLRPAVVLLGGTSDAWQGNNEEKRTLMQNVKSLQVIKGRKRKIFLGKSHGPHLFI